MASGKKRWNPGVIPIICLWLGLVLLTQLPAQNMIFTNPGDIYNPLSGFVNPALISYQESQALLGMKIFHLGFLDHNSLGFKQGYFNTSIPYLVWGKIGMGVNGQYFNAPLYSQTNFSLAFSQKYTSYFSVGLRASLFTKSYNREHFDLVDPADPVFIQGTTKVALSLGGGLFFTPLPNLSLALAADHLNKPNLALAAEKYYQPIVLSGGIKYRFGAFATAFYFRNIGHEFLPFFEVEPSVFDNWRLRLTYGMEALHFDGIVTAFQEFAVGYSYDYPLADFHGASLGSHQLNFTYYLDREPRLPEPLDFGKHEIPFELRENELWLQPRFEVYSTVTSLEIIEKKISRKIDIQLTPEELAYLIHFELGALDSSVNSTPQFFATQSLGANYPEVRRIGLFTESYQQILDQIDSLMAHNPALKTEIITTIRSSNRAAGIQNYLFKHQAIEREQVDVVIPAFKNKLDSLSQSQKVQLNQLKLNEILTVVNHESTTFHIFPIYMEHYDQAWRLKIYNSKGKLVQQFAGQGNTPRQLSWNWRQQDLRFVEPDLYYYNFEWYDVDGQRLESTAKIIDVRKIKRNLTVTVTKQQKEIDQNVRKIGIRLNR